MVKRRVLWASVLLIYGGVIFVLSSLPLTGGAPLFRFPQGDKLLHFLEFGGFFLLSWKAVWGQQRMAIALLLTAFYAGSDEFHQIFVATRQASILDWLADLGGALVASGLLFLFARLLLPHLGRGRILPIKDSREEK